MGVVVVVAAPVVLFDLRSDEADRFAADAKDLATLTGPYMRRFKESMHDMLRVAGRVTEV